MVMVGGLALFASLFVDWYEVGLAEGVSAWTVFEIADLVLAGLAITAIASALPTRLGGAPEPRPLVDPGWVTWVGVAALVFVVVTLLNDPPAVRDRPVEIGAWIGLAGAALIAIGGVLSTSRISIVISSRPAERRTRREAANPLEPESNPLEPEPGSPVEPEATEPLAPRAVDPLEPGTSDVLEPEQTEPFEPDAEPLPDPDATEEYELPPEDERR
jgi:hypothetical protein